MNEEYQDNQEEYNEDSIMDAISASLNDDLSINEEYEPEVEQEVQEPVEEVESLPSDYKVKVKINGEEKEVTLDELKNGYQRQSDYTSKTQELAQQRQELGAKEQEYTSFLQSIPMLAQVAQTNIQEAQGKLYSAEFITLAESDPAQYISEKAKLESIIIQNSNAAQQMQVQYNQYQQQQADYQKQYFEHQLVQANEVLSKEIEGWADGTVIDSLRDFATNSIGFKANELDGLIDPRQVRVLHKAMLYDQMMANQNATQKKVQAVPSKTLRPGTATTTQQQDEFTQKMNKVVSTGNDRDIAALMSQLL
jgi:hypothetical protein